MARRMIALALVICLLLQMGCATGTSVVRVGRNDYNALNDAKRIFVTMKTGERYEIRDFIATDEAIVGTAVARGSSGAQGGEQAVTLKMQDVASIEVEKTESGGGAPIWLYVIGGCLLGTAVLVTLAVIACSRGN
ncbi:MAG TPA: hypothetical protein VII85_10030 [Candidatus Krumholzibacteriaceae bacterium]